MNVKRVGTIHMLFTNINLPTLKLFDTERYPKEYYIKHVD